MSCAKCGKDLPPQEGPGRPRKFCGGICRQTATAEIKRLNSRIAKLERDESNWRIRGADSFATRATKEIERLEERLALLVAAGDDEEATNDGADACIKSL